MDGRPLNIVDMNLLMYGQMDPDCPTLTRQQKEEIRKMMGIAKPKLDGLEGKIQFFGTAGDMESGSQNFAELFNNPSTGYGPPLLDHPHSYWGLVADAPNPPNPKYFTPYLSEVYKNPE